MLTFAGFVKILGETSALTQAEQLCLSKLVSRREEFFKKIWDERDILLLPQLDEGDPYSMILKIYPGHAFNCTRSLMDIAQQME